MTVTLISDEMRAATGAELGRRVSHPVTESDIRRWAIAVYWPTPPPSRFLETDRGPLVAPEDFNPFAWSVASASHRPPTELADLTGGIEAQLGVAGPSLGFILNGGMEATYGAPVRAGDVITAVNRLAGYSERPGRLGTMLFTVTEDTWTNQSGDHVKTVRTTTIRY